MFPKRYRKRNFFTPPLRLKHQKGLGDSGTLSSGLGRVRDESFGALALGLMIAGERVVALLSSIAPARTSLLLLLFGDLLQLSFALAF